MKRQVLIAGKLDVYLQRLMQQGRKYPAWKQASEEAQGVGQ